jgi:DNA-directed RNA polymerase I subunit RPA12
MSRQQHQERLRHYQKTASGKMAFNGLLFCTTCGNLLPRVSKATMPHITCDLCETINTSTSSQDKINIAGMTVTDLSTDDWPEQTSTTSRSTDYPSALQRKCDRFTTLPISQEIASAQQTTNEECPQCHNPEMQFREAQTRGADEGSTIFYTCPKCLHKFNTNN